MIAADAANRRTAVRSLRQGQALRFQISTTSTMTAQTVSPIRGSTRGVHQRVDRDRRSPRRSPPTTAAPAVAAGRRRPAGRSTSSSDHQPEPADSGAPMPGPISPPSPGYSDSTTLEMASAGDDQRRQHPGFDRCGAGAATFRRWRRGATGGGRREPSPAAACPRQPWPDQQAGHPGGESARDPTAARTSAPTRPGMPSPAPAPGRARAEQQRGGGGRDPESAGREHRRRARRPWSPPRSSRCRQRPEQQCRQHDARRVGDQQCGRGPQRSDRAARTARARPPAMRRRRSRTPVR